MTKDNECPKGYILRKGYTRKFKNATRKLGFTVRRNHKVYTVRPRASSVRVPAACIKDRGLMGKGPRDGEGIGPLRKGELIKYGYSYRLPDSQRRSALKRAVDRYGALAVYRKLDAVTKLSMRSAPDASKVFKMDRDWIRNNYAF